MTIKSNGGLEFGPKSVRILLNQVLSELQNLDLFRLIDIVTDGDLQHTVEFHPTIEYGPADPSMSYGEAISRLNGMLAKYQMIAGVSGHMTMNNVIINASVFHTSVTDVDVDKDKLSLLRTSIPYILKGIANQPQSLISRELIVSPTEILFIINSLRTFMQTMTHSHSELEELALHYPETCIEMLWEMFTVFRPLYWAVQGAFPEDKAIELLSIEEEEGEPPS